MRTRNAALTLAAPAVGLLMSACAPGAAVARSNLTVLCKEILVPNAGAVTNGGVAGSGHCTMTGVLHDTGTTTDYRVLNAETIVIRRAVTFAKGKITFVITIPLVGAGGERWTITSGTKTYANLHGQGSEVVDDWQDSPSTFVLKGTVSRV